MLPGLGWLIYGLNISSLVSSESCFSFKCAFKSSISKGYEPLTNCLFLLPLEHPFNCVLHRLLGNIFVNLGMNVFGFGRRVGAPNLKDELLAGIESPGGLRHFN